MNIELVGWAMRPTMRCGLISNAQALVLYLEKFPRRTSASGFGQ